MQSICSQNDNFTNKYNELNNALDERNIKTYVTFAQLGIADISSLTSWAGVLPISSRFSVNTSTSTVKTLFDNGLIPVKELGALTVRNIGNRLHATFVTHNTIYDGYSSNATSTNISWFKTSNDDIGTVYNKSENVAITTDMTQVFSGKAPITIPAGTYIVIREIYNTGGYNSAQITTRVGEGANAGLNVKAADITNNAVQYVKILSLSSETTLSTYFIIDTTTAAVTVKATTTAIRIA